ncbi:unnamed protein product [Miscanthus lutarioriparius]|uniref:F-box protein AT5G49610-like beta-propeller domain-containing protein n=1 Tax=Miscanthus lutarioriparius TaxID=422564 RepID=A0A811P225_9POAL|nr:unnamed protein product [Miscanthus lutarioriparius]
MFVSFTKAYVYSSEANKWSRTASIELPWYVEQRCNSSALVENALYFLQHNNGILEYDLAKNELSVIRLPPICIVSTSIVLMSVEDDGLGFAMMYDDFSLCIWLRESAPTPSGGWTCGGSIKLLTSRVFSLLLTSHAHLTSLLLWMLSVFLSVFLAIDLKPWRTRNASDADAHTVNIIPYMSFCTPVFRAASIDDGPNTVASNNA